MKVIILLLSVYICIINATTYTKSPSDFCTFLQGGTAGGGDTIELTAGVYDRCYINKGGQPGNPLTITAQQSGQVFVSYTGTASNVFDISASYLTIQNLVFNASQSGIHAINFNASVSEIVIQGNTFKGLNGAAVNVNQGDNIQVINNQALTSTYTAFVFGNENGTVAVTNIIVKRNLIANVSNANSYISAGIHFKLNACGLIRDNSIYRTLGPGIETYGWNISSPQTTIIEGNYIEDTGNDVAIAVGGGPAIVRNNVIMYCLSGFSAYDYQKRNLLNNIQLVFNTFISSTYGNLIDLFDVTATSTGNIFSHNAMQIKPGNGYFYPTHPFGNVTNNRNATALSFVNSSIPYDLWPMTNLLGVGNGEPWIPADDFMGVARPANADVGAFQSSSTPNNHTLYSNYTPRPLRVGEVTTTTSSTSSSTSLTTSSSTTSTSSTSSSSTTSTTTTTSVITSSSITTSATTSTSSITSSDITSTSSTSTGAISTLTSSSTTSSSTTSMATTTTSDMTSSSTGAATTTTTSTTTSEMTNSTAPLSSSKTGGSGLSGAATAGIAIGVVLIVGFICVALYIWLKKREGEKQAKTDLVPLQNVTTENPPQGPPKSESQETPKQQLKRTNSIIMEIKDVDVKVKLGGGNFSDVYQGVWQKSSAVALKKLKSETDMNEFMTEATLLQSLNHPHIVRFYGIFVNSENEKYIVTELMDEGSLLNFVSNNKSLSPQELIGFAAQAAAGMKYIEANNVIHRDLALRNLLICKTSTGHCVKVGDLGLGRSLERNYYTTNGKPVPIKWSAPEVVLEGKFTIKSDVWSFGVVLWEIFTHGRLPYPGYSNEEVVRALEKGYRMPKPDKMPNSVAELMDACWNENPESRPSFDKLFIELQGLQYATEEPNRAEYVTRDPIYGITPQ